MAAAVPPQAVPGRVVQGWYRWTDVFFEWHQVLPNADDGVILKALLHSEALIQPDHPLHQEGQEGIELYHGMLLNGESRLMFSSAQLEYLRYWMHVMGLTKDPIPLPSADCLLTADKLQAISPAVYKTAEELMKSHKTLEKANKKLKRATNLVKSRLIFEKTRAFWARRAGAWCAIDFEAWERDHTMLLECGWSYVRFKNGAKEEKQGHFTILDRRTFRNGTYVPDRRQNYNFGESEELPTTAEFRRRIMGLIAELSSDGPLFLIFHDAKGDIEYLRQVYRDAANAEAKAEALQKSKPTPPSVVETPIDHLGTVDLPDVFPESGLLVLDTKVLFAALLGIGPGDGRSLESTCLLLGIPTEFLHNAGNDAHYTMLAFLSMISGEPLDQQRERRWPNHTDPGAQGSDGLKVQFAPHEENPEHDDMEGVAPPEQFYDPVTGWLKGYGPMAEVEDMEMLTPEKVEQIVAAA